MYRIHYSGFLLEQRLSPDRKSINPMAVQYIRTDVTAGFHNYVKILKKKTLVPSGVKAGRPRESTPCPVEKLPPEIVVQNLVESHHLR